MILAKVVGTVVATRKDERLTGAKLLLVRPVDPHGKEESSYLVAVDTVDEPADPAATVRLLGFTASEKSLLAAGPLTTQLFWRLLHCC